MVHRGAHKPKSKDDRSSNSYHVMEVHVAHLSWLLVEGSHGSVFLPWVLHKPRIKAWSWRTRRRQRVSSTPQSDRLGLVGYVVESFGIWSVEHDVGSSRLTAIFDDGPEHYLHRL